MHTLTLSQINSGVAYGHHDSTPLGLWVPVLCGHLIAFLEPGSIRPSLPFLLLLIHMYLLISKTQKMLYKAKMQGKETRAENERVLLGPLGDTKN